MRILTVIALLAGIVLISNNGLFSQEKKDPPTKLKGMLPSNYGKLGLSDEQKQSIYKVQAKYDDEEKKLKQRLDEIKLEQKREYEKVLTADQKKRLFEILTGTKPDEPKK